MLNCEQFIELNLKNNHRIVLYKSWKNRAYLPIPFGTHMYIYLLYIISETYVRIYTHLTRCELWLEVNWRRKNYLCGCMKSVCVCAQKQSKTFMVFFLYLVWAVYADIRWRSNLFIYVYAFNMCFIIPNLPCIGSCCVVNRIYTFSNSN